MDCVTACLAMSNFGCGNQGNVVFPHDRKENQELFIVCHLIHFL